MMKKINQEQLKLLNKLKLKDKRLVSVWSDELSLFKEIRGALDKLGLRQKPATLAISFVTKFNQLFGPKALKKNYLVFRDVESRDGGRRISINYTVDKLVVLGGQINVMLIKEES